MPRWVRKQSNGPGTAPIAFWWKVIASARSRSRTTTAPPTTSLCPPTYLVVECTTMSAPRVSGCWRYGEAKVLSTTSSAPASWATGASASMSPMASSGLVGVSTQTIRVCPGRIAARTASRSETGAGVCSRPQGFSTLSKSRNVPPYASSGITSGRPGLVSPRRIVSSAARPLANAKPRSPSSSAASAPSSAVRVGLALRLYS